MQKSLILFSIVVMAIISYPGKAEEWISYTHANGLVENEVTSVFVRGNKAWFGTASGVSMYNGCRWKNYLRDIHVNDIVEDKTGEIWAATEKGVIAFSLDREGGLRERQTYLPELHVHAIAVDRRNVKWIGTENAIWSTPDGTTWEDYRAAESGFAERIAEIAEKESSSADLKWESNEIKSIAIDDNDIKWLGFHSILKTGSGNWVLTGIASFDGEKFELIEESARLSTLGNIVRPGMVTSVAVDREGNIWYTRSGHEGGAFKFDGEEVTIYDSLDLSGDGLWTGEQSSAAAIKTDNRTILVSTATTPYDLQPRGVFLYDAETGEEIWGYRMGPAPHPNNNVAIGDVTGDGVPEIVVGGESPMNGSQANGTVDAYGYIFILDLNGRNLWGNGQSEPLTGPTGAAHQIAIADLDGDGVNDVVGFLSGNTDYAPDVGTIGVGVIVTDSKGRQKYRYYHPYKASIDSGAVADLDNDGKLEVLIIDGESRLLILDNRLSLLCESEILISSGSRLKVQ